MPDDDSQQGSTAQWRRERLIARFEDAWCQGFRPAIADYLLGSDPDRLALLVELVHLDLEYRLKAGEEVAVEQYWEQYPELKQSRPEALSLIAAEYTHRHRQSPDITPMAFLKRFADFGDELRPLLEAAAAAESLPAGEPARPPRELPRIPGYEILAVLGHGGMGVVYQARQLSLNRLVALKMVLTGLPEDAQALARFRTEAETVARLQHPNIVQIHEIGEADGRPYLALELVDGGSLERRLHGNPQPAEGAARLMETLARTLAYAHDRGIIHRDLKPGNILLQGTDKETRRQGDKETGSNDSLSLSPCLLVSLSPKITDFGLAKRLDLPAGHTQSGDIVGTPSYMAPEQALGQTRAIGPAADIYALGAILYQLLTGRPPFKGASSLDTVWQVIHDEPVPPARLQPRVPRDLETICLTCLHKEPRKRYPSAEALAEDLRRFQAGEPIWARPVRSWERAAKWARRRPAAAGLIGVSIFGMLLLTGGSLFYNARLRFERDRAERNSQHALQAADTLVGELAEGIKPIAGTQSATVKRILDRAAQVYENLLREDPSPRAREGKARMLTDFATIYLELNQSGKAVESARQAVAILEPLTQAEPTNRRLRSGLARAQETLGRIYHEQDYPEPALAALRVAVDLGERLTREEPENAAWQADLARAYGYLGNVLLEQQDTAGARAVFQKALTIEDQLVQRQPDPGAGQRDLAAAHEHLGDVFFQTSAYAQAIASYQRALALYQELVDKDPNQADWARDLARVKLSLAATYYWDNDSARAREYDEAALQIAERLAQTDPANTQWQRLKLGCQSQLVNHALKAPVVAIFAARTVGLMGSALGHGPLLTASTWIPGKTRKSQRELLQDNLRITQEIVRLAERFAQRDPQRLRWQHDLAVSYIQLALAYQGLAKWGIAPPENFAQALEALQRSFDVEKQVRHRIPTSIRGSALLSTSYFALAQLYITEEKPYEELLHQNPKALPHCRDSLEHLRDWYQQFPASNPGPIVAEACPRLLKPLLRLAQEGQAEARSILANGMALLHKLQADKQLNPEQEKALRDLEKALKDLKPAS